MNLFYRRFFKRTIDIVISLSGLVMASPLILVISALLIISNNDSCFFFQQRVGKNNKPFKLLKFKTMKDVKDDQGYLLPDNFRLTAIGKTLRKSSLDELPQLLNVLIGDMSLIGPRPLLPEYLPLYNTEQIRRHEIKPGITGWAQINGRNSISWERRFELDIWYVDHLSFKLDIKILFITFLKVFKREGINTSTHETMVKFTGTKER